jgi:hypothetical protein
VSKFEAHDIAQYTNIGEPTMAHRAIVITVEAGETHQESFLRRLKDANITQRAICEVIGMDPSHFSRNFGRMNAVGEPIGISIAKVLEIEEALEMLKDERRQEKSAKTALRRRSAEERKRSGDARMQLPRRRWRIAARLRRSRNRP